MYSTRSEPCRFLTVYPDLCASVRVSLVGVAVGVVDPNAPRGNRAGGTFCTTCC